MQEGSNANKKTSLTLPSNGTTALQSREERISKIEARFFIPGEESAPLSFLGTIAFTDAAREGEKSRCKLSPKAAREFIDEERDEGTGACGASEEEELPPRNRSIDRPAACATREERGERERASCGRGRRPRRRPPPKIECTMLT